MRVVAALAIAGSLLVACQSAAPPPPTPAQPTRVPAATAAPVAVPTSTPAPLTLPTLVPAVVPSPPRPAPTSLPTVPAAALGNLPLERAQQVRDGRSALAAGDNRRASRLFEPLLDELSGEQQAELRLLYGQALVGGGQFDAGHAAAENVLASTTRADLVSAASLLKGQALRGLQRYDEAATAMRAAADANPLVAAGVRLELEDMWLAANRPDEAAADGQKGLDIAQPRLLKIQLAENLAQADVALNQTDAAMDAYRQLLTAAGSNGYLGEQLYNLADGESRLGRTDDAINALRTAIAEFPRSRTAPNSVELLEKLGGMRPADRFYAGVIRYLFWNFAGARADFDAYLVAFSDGDRAVEARYYRGLSSPARDTTTLLLRLAADVPDDDFAPLALLEAGKAQEELGDYATAEQIYAELVATYPTRDAGLAGGFRLGLARYMGSDFSGALSAWNDLLGRGPEAPVRAETLYWSGKASVALGDDVAGRQKYEAAAAVRPVDYYVMRAQVALDPPPPTSFDTAGAEPIDEADVAQWFASHGLDVRASGQAASQDPAFLRAQALVQHGLYRQANWEYEIFLTTYVDKPDRLYWLASRFGELGLPNAALMLGTAALKAATAEGQVSILEVPRALARAASPLVYPHLVASAASVSGLDPLLLTSLIRQESSFDPNVESVANARGLTQIIPRTGAEIARALGVSDFAPDELFQPQRNIQFGAYYFAQRLKRNGSAERALAAYNAGDGNVDNWTGAERKDPDVFTEYVPFAETNDYVKKIQMYWWISRYIWAP